MSVSDPFLSLNLMDQIGRTNLLANPRIRVKNMEHAKILIRDRVPVITTTTTATGFAAESVSYLDVGLKLDVERNRSPGRRGRHQDRARSLEYRSRSAKRVRHPHLPGRHAHCEHSAKTA